MIKCVLNKPNYGPSMTASGPIIKQAQEKYMRA